MPRMPSPIAVVDLGSNSTRLLVALVEDGRVRELERRSEITRLGQGVDRSGALSDEAMERVFAVLAEYRREIDQHGADRVVAVATSAVRDSSNGDRFRSELSSRFGIDARVLTGDQEARMTFHGATAGRHGAERTLVIDIGGGSTEFVIGSPGTDPEFHVSTQAGSVRQSERHLHDDPPTPEQLAALRGEMREIIAGAVPEPLRAGVERGIAVAGTATQLAAVAQGLESYDPARVDGYTLSAEECERLLALLASRPLAERRQIKGLHPDRAPTIVAGTAILLEALAGFGLQRVEVAEADILHGAALEASATQTG